MGEFQITSRDPDLWNLYIFNFYSSLFGFKFVHSKKLKQKKRLWKSVDNFFFVFQECNKNEIRVVVSNIYFFQCWRNRTCLTLMYLPPLLPNNFTAVQLQCQTSATYLNSKTLEPRHTLSRLESHNSSFNTHPSFCSSISCSCSVIKSLYVVSSHCHVAAEGPAKCCWQCTGWVALEWRKQQGQTSIGWKIRSLPCNSAAAADIIRLQSDIRQVIPPTDCNR